MKALLSRLLQSLARRRSNTANGANMQNAAPDFDFSQLNDRDQEVVRKYFGAVIELVQLTKSIRGRHVAVDTESVLTAFEQCERAYIWAGMRPIFPPAIFRVSSFDPAKLVSEGLLIRLGAMEKPVVYSPAMRRHVTKLTVEHRPRMLDSQAYNPMS